MKKRSLFWPFFGVHTAILLLAVCSISLYAWYTSILSFDRKWMRELHNRTLFLASFLPPIRAGGEENLDAFLKALPGKDRYTFTLPDGSVIGDSLLSPEALDPHPTRPEISEALERGMGFSKRYSASLKVPCLYLALRIPEKGSRLGVLRISIPYHEALLQQEGDPLTFLAVTLIVLLFSLGLSYFAALRIIGPVSMIQNGLARIGGGELGHRLPLPPVPHLNELTRSINRTAERLQRYITELAEERNLRTLILENMSDGLIAIDQEHRLLSINRSAKFLLGTESDPTGREIGTTLNIPEIFTLLDACERSGTAEEEETSGKEGNILHIRATVLNDLIGRRIGTLMILRDVTRIRSLERVRQDFVANVSHELRTPVTSIKGFAETLLENGSEDLEANRRFLPIIARQATLLEHIISDLLELSRLESRGPDAEEFVETPLHEVMEGVGDLFKAEAEKRGIALEVDSPPDLSLPLLPGLLGQAIGNLVDNALKYGSNGENPRITLSARRVGREVRIEVSDNGNGIPRENRARIFERFYRIDKGRSRALGGTGLGLAIVKHIAMIHNGSVQMESEIGKGTTFSIVLREGKMSTPSSKHALSPPEG